MKKIPKYFILGLSILITACGPKENHLIFQPLSVEDTIYLQGSVFSDSLLIRAAQDIDYDDSCIFVLASSEGYFLHCFNRQNGKSEGHFIPHGRGPGELLGTNSFQLHHDSGIICCFDPLVSKRYEYRTDSLLKNKKYHRKEYPVKHSSRDVIPLGEINFCGLGATRDRNDRFYRMYLTRGDSVLCRYSAYPSWRNDIEKDLALLYCYTGKYDIAPSGKCLAIATTLGAILEIFTLSDDSIHLETTKGFIKPVYQVIGNQIYPLPEHTIWGFHDIYTTNRCIYTLYSGNTKGTEGPMDIAVFDWQGNLVKFYRTGYRLDRLCVDESRKELYAVGLTSGYETAILKFRLED